MNKHVIIAGCSRTGKTTLSRKIRELGFNHYKMDTIKRGIENNFVPGRYELWSEVSPLMAKLIKRIIDESRTDATLEDNYVIDTCHVYPEDLAKYDFENTIIVFLGYPNISAKDKVNKIRKYDKDFSWTRCKDDEYLLKWAPYDIKYSIEAEKQCKKYNYAFFDTSKNFNKVLDSAYEYILERLGE